MPSSYPRCCTPTDDAPFAPQALASECYRDKHLFVSHQLLGTGCCRLIAQYLAASLRCVRVLTLSHCGVKDAGAAELATALKVTELNIDTTRARKSHFARHRGPFARNNYSYPSCSLKL